MTVPGQATGSARKVWFEQVDVHRVLGIGRDEGFSMPAISPNVNLIVGPNGSGKTTTARVIHELLWPGRTGLDRPSAGGVFHFGEQTWSVNIDAGSVDSSCDGLTGTTPDFGPVELSQRYHLALHDLLGADNADFARQIKQSSQGGFDLEAAAEVCGFSATPTRRRAAADTLALSRKTLEEAKRRQGELDKDFRDLARYELERDEANRAGRSIAQLEKARDVLESREELRELEGQRDALPEILGRMHGDEQTKLDAFEQRDRELAEKLAEERKSIAHAESDIDALGLGPDEASPETLSELRSSQRVLTGLESDQRAQEQVLEKARATAETARQRLGDTFTDEQLAGLQTVEIENLLPFARETAQVRAQRATLDEQRRRLELEETAGADALDPARLRTGLAALSGWLTASETSAGPAPTQALRSKGLLIACVAAALLSIALALTLQPGWALLSLPAIALLVLDLLRPVQVPGQAAPHARGVHKSAFEQTGLGTPTDWTIDAVTNQVGVITGALEASLRHQARKDRLAGLTHDEESLCALEATLAARRVELQQQLGLTLATDDLWLPLLVENLIAWQRQTALCDEARASIAAMIEKQRTLLDAAGATLRPFGLSNPRDSGVLAETAQDLDDRQGKRRASRNQQLATQKQIDEFIEPDRASVATERRELLSALGLEDGEEHRIPGWLKEYERFQSLLRDIDRGAAVCESRTAALEGDEELLGLDRHEIEARIAEQRRQAERHDGLSDEIAGIKSRVEAAKRGFDLTDCASEFATATAALTEMKEHGDAAVVGAGLVDWVRAVAIETSRPLVFRRANELFISFTKGALQLDIDDSATPARFLARRGSEAGRPVDQLSVGERVQLLMAVRIAFLEQSEIACLPLLMDEVLGTSDDRRAGAIIDTVMTIARSGRQVFYFTAQDDEVDKWRARLQSEDIGHRVIDLAVVRKMSAAAHRPLTIAPIKRAPTPAPDGRTHLEYAELLEVPAFTPRAPHLDDLHLWHVIDDVKLLRRLLEQDIRTWSQFDTLRKHEGTGLFDIDERHIHRIDITRRAIEAACVAWRVGRGRLVDRVALQDSECVSEVYLDKLAELSEEFGGDARRLIEALSNQEVSRWQQKNTTALSDFFEAEGFLVPGEPLTLATIRLRALAAVGTDFQAGVITDATIDRIVGSLPPV